MEQTITMVCEEEITEVGPNDIVIHLVNPYKCGLCDLEFLEKSVFKEHMFLHLEHTKQDHPSSQIVMTITLPPETPGGVTVTRDILELGEDGSIRQILQPTASTSLNQVSQLRALEEAGVLKLQSTRPQEEADMKISIPIPTPLTKPSNNVTTININEPQVHSINLIQESLPSVVSGGVEVILNDSTIKTEIVPEMSELADSNEQYLTFAFKGPNDEMQHVQIIKPEGAKVEDMVLELTNTNEAKRGNRNGVGKNSICDICGKVLSTSTNLMRHKMYHSAERPFVCEVCNKGFKDACNLKKHTIIHKRIFPCHLCKKSFLRKSLLAVHLRRHETRTATVKTGNSMKEVKIRTFVDVDGTRVEEMCMAALGGQTFEYKQRIVKADPSESMDQTSKDGEEKSKDMSDAGTSTEPDLSISESDDRKEKKKTVFMVTTNGLQETVLKEEGQRNAGTSTLDSTVEFDDLPDMKIPIVPEDFVKLYQCGHCGKRTVQRGNMMRHLIHHLKEKPFVCDQCPKQFVDKGELVKHKKTHTKPYRCPQCNGAFAHNAQLLRHLQSTCLGSAETLNYSVLEDGKTYKCDICRIEMKRLGNMIKHVGTHSIGSKSTWHHRQTHYRPKKISASRSLDSSESRKPEASAYYYYDTNQKTYICCFCSKGFAIKSNVLEHVRVHTKDKQYPCTECDEWFSCSSTLKKHLEFHTKPFKCDLCSSAFPRKIFLDMHKKKHFKKEKDEETANYGLQENKAGYYCKHCQKKLSNKYKMLNHIKRHLHNRPFECPTCNKCFTCQYMLLKHKKVHTKPFACKFCGAAFTRKLFLTLHKKNVHNINREVSVAKPELLDSTDSPIDDRQVFPCSICGAPFSRLVIKMNHEKKCYEESKVMIRLPEGKGYKCKICGKIASLKHNLMVHIRKHTDILRVENTGKVIIVDEAFSKSLLPLPIKPGNETIAEKLDANGDKPAEKKVFKKGKKRFRLESGSATSDSYMEEEESNEELDFNVDNDGRFQRIPGGYTCLDCRRKFSDYEGLITHLDSHGDKAGKEEIVIVRAEEKKRQSKKSGDPEKKIKVEKKEAEEENKQKTPANSAKKKELKKTPKESNPESTPTTSKAKKSEIKMETPNATRSANRPARIQKMPSRFLE